MNSIIRTVSARFGLVLVALTALAAVARAGEATPGDYRALLHRPIRTQCGMGVCLWITLEKIAPAGRSDRGSLYNVTLRYDTSSFDDSDPGRKANRRFSARTTPSVLCSRQDPAVVEKGDGPDWDFIQVAPASTFIAMSESTFNALYWAACHATAVENGNFNGTPDEASKLGYKPRDASPINYKIATPADALKPPPPIPGKP